MILLCRAVQFYSVCDRWQREVKDNDPVTLAQRRLFETSDSMMATLKAVSKRLGFNATVGMEDALVMYDICRFERAKKPEESSPWCSAFDKDDLMVGEGPLRY